MVTSFNGLLFTKRLTEQVVIWWLLTFDIGIGIYNLFAKILEAQWYS